MLTQLPRRQSTCKLRFYQQLNRNYLFLISKSNAGQYRRDQLMFTQAKFSPTSSNKIQWISVNILPLLKSLYLFSS